MDVGEGRSGVPKLGGVFEPREDRLWVNGAPSKAQISRKADVFTVEALAG